MGTAGNNDRGYHYYSCRFGDGIGDFLGGKPRDAPVNGGMAFEMRDLEQISVQVQVSSIQRAVRA